MTNNRFASYLADVNPFVLKGKTIKNMEQLAKELTIMDDKTFSRHNNSKKNDFYCWIRDSVGDKRLARDIMNIRLKQNMLDIVRKRITQLTDYIRHPEHSVIEKRIEMYVDRIVFSIDNELCSNCEICTLVCPKEAVEIAEGIKTLSDDCTLCSFCVNFCPVAAISWTHNDKSENFFVEKKMIPRLGEKENVNDTEAVKFFKGTLRVKDKCPPGCELCVAACPMNIITRFDSHKQLDKVKIKKEHCLLCGACKNACPYDLIENHRVYIIHEGDEYCNSWNRAIEKLTGVHKKNIYHNNKNVRKITGLVERSGLKKYD